MMTAISLIILIRIYGLYLTTFLREEFLLHQSRKPQANKFGENQEFQSLTWPRAISSIFEFSTQMEEFTTLNLCPLIKLVFIHFCANTKTSCSFASKYLSNFLPLLWQALPQYLAHLQPAQVFKSSSTLPQVQHFLLHFSIKSGTWRLNSSSKYFRIKASKMRKDSVSIFPKT